MFDFEKLDVYQVVKDQNLKVLHFLEKNKELDRYLMEQWKRASLSIFLILQKEPVGWLTQIKNSLLISPEVAFTNQLPYLTY